MQRAAKVPAFVNRPPAIKLPWKLPSDSTPAIDILDGATRCA
jgi:hypothetical protein